jgi:pimeloyl-ACP methyl ester carboxylesterase
MAKASCNGIELEYEVAGDPSAPVILLVMGLGAQLIVWEDGFVDELVARGFRVIRYDNRDVGLSTWFDESGVPDLMTGFMGGDFPAPAYTLEDMADDAAGLLDALDVRQAHVVGASMGGMIAQTFALRHPDRTASLTSIMSTTGDRAVGTPKPEVVQALFFSGAPTTKEEAIAAGIASQRLIGSPGFPFDEPRIVDLASRAWDRSLHPEGTARQLLAIVTQADRTSALGSLVAPTLVIHGEADVLVAPSGGLATADAVPGAELWMIPGMGHEVPAALFAEVAERIAIHCKSAA